MATSVIEYHLTLVFATVKVSVVQWLSRSPNTRKVPSSSLGGNKFFSSRSYSIRLHHFIQLFIYILLYIQLNDSTQLINIKKSKTQCTKKTWLITGQKDTQNITNRPTYNAIKMKSDGNSQHLGRTKETDQYHQLPRHI